LSNIILGKAWLLPMSPTIKLVFVSLCDQANDDGVCWPSVATICRRTCLDDRTVQRSYKWLQENGYLTRYERPGRSTVFRIHIGEAEHRNQVAPDDIESLTKRNPVTLPPRHTAGGNEGTTHLISDTPPPSQCHPTPVTPPPRTIKEPSIEPEPTPLSGEAPDDGHGPGMNGNKPRIQQARDILIFLNEKAGRNYQPVEANTKLIIARLKEGYTEAELRQIVMRKCRDWKADDEMQSYLRPATLFNAQKCAQYRGELV